jgi:hypothetical protein
LSLHLPRWRPWLGLAAIAITLSAHQPEIPGGFQREEASALLDLNEDIHSPGVPGTPHPDTSAWTLVAAGLDPGNPAGDFGFGPFASQWKLWKRKTDATFALAIRGTIPKPVSMEEDLLSNMIPADQVVIPAGGGQAIPFALASPPGPGMARGPKVHAGFAYGLAAVLFDGRHGLLKALRREVPAGSHLYLTGHSLGAALATLTASFLVQAGADPQAPLQAVAPVMGRFGLVGKAWSIKTYAFGQPKPGNPEYAEDVARLMGRRGAFFTILNQADPVPRLPLTFGADEGPGRPARGALWRLASSLIARASLAADRAERKRIFLEGPGQGYAGLLDDEYQCNHVESRPQGSQELDFTPAGQLVLVAPRPEDDPPEREAARKKDLLWEHHLWRYRSLSRYWP